ncbi:uncharacterized protein LOC103516898 [Diaphorina citri]|uniref:Uncharacterized protein LOC103516898 n=1 Tax=Diaphorina citri TaxID=121845 RepID=A0A1S3DE92_DIACI|nr:uncharacterized protein LOC103516898 [Diaphorina citri]
MNWWLTIPLVVALVQSEVPETSAQVNVEENGVLDQVRDKRKTEENKKGSDQQPVQYCGYILRNNRLHALRKRSRHIKGHMRGKKAFGPIKEPSRASTMVVKIKSIPLQTNTSTSSPDNTSNTDQTNITEPITPCMENQIKLKHKNNVLIKGRKHCIYHEKHQDVLNDRHHREKVEPARAVQVIQEIQDNDQSDQRPVVYEVYTKDLKPTNTVIPIVPLALGDTSISENHIPTNAGTPATNMADNLNKNVDLNYVGPGEAKSKATRSSNKLKNCSGKMKAFDQPNMIDNHTNQERNGNRSNVNMGNAKKRRYDESQLKESQEIDLFTPIKELEAFIASMSKDDCENYFQQYWKPILLVSLLLFLLLICCVYYCMTARVKSSNDATLFLIKPSSHTSTNLSSDSLKYKRKEKPRSRVLSTLKSKLCDTDTDDYTTGRDRKSIRGYGKQYRKEMRNIEEEECLIRPKHDRFDTRRSPRPKRAISYTYRGSNTYNCYKVDNVPDHINSDHIINNYCFYSNKEIRELFKQDPKHIYHFSSVDCQSGKPCKPESNVESYAETVTSSARSRFQVTKTNNKRSRYVKKKGNK